MPVAIIYHAVFENEGFEESAQKLFKLVQNAQEKSPGVPRLLYLDIDGHKNAQGEWDHDMWELQYKFVGEFLLSFLTDVPGLGFKNENQNNDIPKMLKVTAGE